MAATIDTRMIDVVAWAAHTTTLLAPYGTVPILHDPAKWQDWAGTVITFPAIAALGPPRPRPFQDWQDWARRFNAIAGLLTA